MRKVPPSTLKERVLQSGGNLSGVLGFFGSYQVCHNVCTAVVSSLAILGITLKGMPLLFLQKVAVPFWTLAVVVLIVMTLLRWQKKACISPNALLFNSGIIIAGVPFLAVQNFLAYFWVVGGLIVLTSINIFIRKKLR